MTTRHQHKEKLNGLYAISDEQLITEDSFEQAIRSALQGGSRIIQYRDKSGDRTKRLQQARVLQALCAEYQAISIINDDIELAKAVNADGVHLGKHDISLAQARDMLGENRIIGISCYDDLDIALTAEKNNADYVAFGAMFSSATKPEAVQAGPELIATAKQQLSIPVCAIGGISEKNITQVIHQGADMAAVISSLFSCQDIKQAALSLSQQFTPR